jgi:hypothetical protein
VEIFEFLLDAVSEERVALLGEVTDDTGPVLGRELGLG